VTECDLYLAIVGFRYGSRVPGRPDGVSYTELEFLVATEAGMPRLVFVLDEDVAVPRSLVDKDSSAVDGFRGKLHRAGVIVKTIATPAGLGEAVLHALYELRPHRLQPGGDRAATASGRGDATAAEPVALGGLRRPWMAPPLDRIVERPELGGRLVAALAAPGRAEVGLTTALQGAGGFGKTTLAAWACHRPEVDRRFPGGLLWVTVGQEVHGADLAERVNDLAFVLSGGRPAISDPDVAGAELGRLLDERESVLLVVDDVWEASQLRPFRFGGRDCTRLVTTRIPDLLPGGGPRVTVDAMSAGQARTLVASGVDGLPAQVTERLSAVSGRWPVLLNLVNGVLRRRVARGQAPEAAAGEILRLLAAHGPAALDPSRPAERARAVAATIQASLALLAPDDRQRYLDLAIFPEDVDIPLDVLALLWPDTEVDALCEDLAGLGLAADYRLDAPGPRLVLHDVIRAYLRARRSPGDRAGVHRRLVDAAAGLLPVRGELGHGTGPDRHGPTPWWTLPAEAGYLWRFLAYHLHGASRTDDLAALVCDLRWAEAKTRRSGSAVGVQADLHLANTPAAAALEDVLRRSAHLLGPIDPPAALGATLASRLHGVPGLEDILDRYRSTLPRPRLEPAWPLPDRHDSTQAAPTGHTGSVTDCAFSPDGVLLATTSDDGTARLWEVATRSTRTVLAGHTGGVWGCAFSPDGAMIITVGDDRTVRLWQVADGETEAVLAGHTGWVTGCAFSPDGALLATTSDDGTVRLWDVATRSVQKVLAGHTGGVWACAFHPNGALLATAGQDGTARLWHVADGTEAAVLAGHTDRVWACEFSPDGALLATAGQDGTARLWHVASGTEAAVLAGHTHRVLACAFAPNGELLATVGEDGAARLWGVPDGAQRAVLTCHPNWERGCAFSPDGALLATASNDHTARLWHVADGTPHAVLASPVSRVSRCAFSSDGTLLATTAYDHTARLWHVASGSETTILTGHTSGVWGCAFSPDGTLLATTSNDQTVRLWHLPDGTEQTVLTGHASKTKSCVFSPDGTILATGGNDGTARLWRVRDGEPRAVLTHTPGRVNSCAFSPDGTLLATANDDRTARLWRLPDGTEQAVLTGHTDGVNACAFSPDGALLATAGDDRTARLWHLPDGTEQAVLTGHASTVECCAFNPDGTLLATTGRDGTVRLWRVADGRCHCALRVTGPLVGIAWHPHDDIICAVGGAGIYLLAMTS
jgi:WD40 repeat protein